MLNRGHSIVTIKSIDEERRLIQGIATTPAVDSYGDIVEPKGVKSKADIPLFLYHDSTQTVGRARLGRGTDQGVPFEASIPDVKESGRLKDRVDEAWQMLKYRLITGVSIGFQVIEDQVERMKNGGLRFLECEVLELSLVPIPANQEATITAIKSADAALRALSGPEQRATARATAPSGFKTKGTAVKTLQQLIEERATKSARASELIELKQKEGRAFTDDERAEMGQLDADVAQLDDDIVVQRFHERQAATATRVSTGDPLEQRASRGPTILVRKQDPDDTFKGQSFIRGVIAKAASALLMKEGSFVSAADIAKHRWGQTHPNLVRWIQYRAAVPGAGTGTGEWGAELAQADTRYNGDFVEFLYSLTVFDRLPLRPVPENIHVKGQDGAAIGYWVGESKAIPVSKADFSDVELKPLKVGALAVCSKEWIRLSSPSGELYVRDAIGEASAQRVDTTFLSADAAVANVSPAGMLNGLTPLAPSDITEAAVRNDAVALAGGFVTAKMASGLVWVMNPGLALAIGSMTNTFSQPSFPGLSENGGTFLNRPVFVGDNVTSGDLILMRPRDIWKIGDTGVEVSVSDSAAIEMTDAPAGASDTPVGMASHIVSMFQTESMALKVVRGINFAKRRSNAVAVLSNAEYGGVQS